MLFKIKKNGAAHKGELAGIFALIDFIHRYRIYRLFDSDKILAHALGILLGRLILQRSETYRKKVSKSLRALYPWANDKEIRRILNAFFIGMGDILADIMIRLPNMDSGNLNRYAYFEGLEYLDSALSRGKGVIIASIHVSNPFYLGAAFAFHPKRYDVVGVANLANRMLFESLIAHKGLRNLHVVGTDKFSKIKGQLEYHLKKKRLVIIMCDFANKRQLHVPFLPDSKLYNYILPFPQSAAYFSRRLGTPIVPCLVHEKTPLKPVSIEFLPPIYPELHSSKRPQDGPRNISEYFKFHGEVSKELVRIFTPHLLKYPFYWTELRGFYGKIRDVIEISAEVIKGSPEKLRELSAKLIDKLNFYIFNTFPKGYEIFGIVSFKEIRGYLENLTDEFDNILHEKHNPGINNSSKNQNPISFEESLIKIMDLAFHFPDLEVKIDTENSQEIIIIDLTSMKLEFRIIFCIVLLAGIFNYPHLIANKKDSNEITEEVRRILLNWDADNLSEEDSSINSLSLLLDDIIFTESMKKIKDIIFHAYFSTKPEGTA